jgi:hypothetical protein
MINLYHIIEVDDYDILKKNNENIEVIFFYFCYDEVIVIKINICLFYPTIALIFIYCQDFIIILFFN